MDNLYMNVSHLLEKFYALIRRKVTYKKKSTPDIKLFMKLCHYMNPEIYDKDRRSNYLSFYFGFPVFSTQYG